MNHLEAIDSYDRLIAKTNKRIYQIARSNKQIQLLKTIPGIGDYSALAIIAEIDDVKRFSPFVFVCRFGSKCT
ncbi:MAG: Transposase [Cenarchaeum symbiont of Oopsacas minuta]|nr:Transposase [Cenarchaeum symbiont of Oopsacas minuta]